MNGLMFEGVKRFKTMIFLLSASLCLISNYSLAAPIIKWAKYQMPPVFISKGPFKSQGTGDLIFDFFQQHLPEYQHIEYRSTGARIFRDFANEGVICSTFTNKKGRGNKMLFSEPIGVLPTHNLFFLEHNSKIVSQLESARIKGKLSLEKLLEQSPDLIIGIYKLRSYGKGVNEILKRYDRQIINFDETQSLVSIFKLIQSKRIDVTLEFPFISHFAMRSAQLTLPLRIEAVAENLAFVNAFIACSDNLLGQKAVEDINAVILQHRATKAYVAVFEKWVPQAALISYRKGYQSFLITSELPLID